MPNKFVSFLKSLGKGLLTGVTDIAAVLGMPGIQPMANAMVTQYAGPLAGRIESGLFNIVQQVELYFSAAYPNAQTGPDKLKAALPAVQALIQQSEFMADKQVMDEAMFTAGLTDLINGSVKIQNAVQHKAAAPADSQLGAGTAAGGA